MGMLGWAKDGSVRRPDRAAAHLWIEDHNAHPVSLCGRMGTDLIRIRHAAIEHGEPTVNLCSACLRTAGKIAAEQPRSADAAITRTARQLVGTLVKVLDGVNRTGKFNPPVSRYANLRELCSELQGLLP